jgi:hypothetical protein
VFQQVLLLLLLACRYSGLLVAHADRVLGAAAAVLNKPGRPRLIKQAVQVGTAVGEMEGGGKGVHCGDWEWLAGEGGPDTNSLPPMF